ncbi:aspartyl-phosphate phosphatase Spo0E family protein [Desulfofundulus thermocisternus]|jgi:Holliday junction resolvase-like predicted endonuclease|uniref:aspartyl-phosphate phosphatase Spo0E family protein n=1 Tax=Desulfofundulus thermocisternus TaxID=42471 RepID=UPI00217DD878|nr:aspartyl-phosphate phosphatase Spo0E family protein [Desulfofundulus thermocisternus]MCS5696960.1 aspartyl-phosphate phosphatase Spo0E family protein [Desulfofundulus thermocisternus]
MFNLVLRLRLAIGRRRLHKLACMYGLNHPKVLACSCRLDRLIVAVQKSRLKLQGAK